MTTIRMNIGADGPVLNAFIADRSRRSFVRGPYGSGKTYAAAQKLLMLMQEQEPNQAGERHTRWIAIRNTFPDLMTTTAKDAQDVWRGLGRMTFGGSYEPPCFYLHFRMPDNTVVISECWFQALDRPEHAKKLKGKQVTGIWLSETTELDKAVVDAADARVGRFPKRINVGVEPTWRGLVGDTNSCSQTHWYYKLAEKLRPKNWTFFTQPPGVVPVLDEQGEPIDGEWQSNPAAENRRHLNAGLPPDEDYYTSLCEGKDDSWIRVFAANEWGFTRLGKPVHPAYIDSVMCAKADIPFDPTLPLFIGSDFGRTPAAVLGQVDHVDRVRVIDEYVTDGQRSAASFGHDLKLYLDRNYEGAEIIGGGDPSGASPGEGTDTAAIEFMNAAGIPMDACETNNPLYRRAALNQPMTRLAVDGKVAFLMSPKCVRLREGLMGGWSYRRIKVSDREEYHDTPDKGPYSHVCEAAEYMAMAMGETDRALVAHGFDDEPISVDYGASW